MQSHAVSVHFPPRARIFGTLYPSISFYGLIYKMGFIILFYRAADAIKWIKWYLLFWVGTSQPRSLSLGFLR